MTNTKFDIRTRPAQWQGDVGEIVSAYRAGGQALATRSYRAICEARKLVQWTALSLGEDVRQVIKDNDEWQAVFSDKDYAGDVK